MPNTSTGTILEALNDKMDRDGHNPESPTDVVIEYQAPTSANGGAWYRKYASGWVEQGKNQSTMNTTITLLVPMANADYFIGFVGFTIANHGAQYINNKTTTSFGTYSNANNSLTQAWWVCGMAAS